MVSGGRYAQQGKRLAHKIDEGGASQHHKAIPEAMKDIAHITLLNSTLQHHLQNGRGKI